MHIIELSTRHYEFRAAGATANDAWDALVKGWQAHCDQTAADPDYFDDCIEYEIREGMCLRDADKQMA